MKILCPVSPDTFGPIAQQQPCVHTRICAYVQNTAREHQEHQPSGLQNVLQTLAESDLLPSPSSNYKNEKVVVI